MSLFHNNIFADLGDGSTVYFVGIGGISMSGLAEIAQGNGWIVVGSDSHESEHTEHLRSLGIKVYIGQKAEQIDSENPELIVYSSAVPLSNPELVRGRELDIPIAERGDFLGWITNEFDRVINVAGTHGKTTTTAMCSLMLLASGVSPTVHLGAEFDAFNNSTVRMGDNQDLLVSESCEFRNSFLHFVSTTAIVTNIDTDHLDFFGNLDNIITAFAGFCDLIKPDGYLIIPQGGANIDRMLQELQQLREAGERSLPRLVTFGALPDQVDLEPWPEETQIAVTRHIDWENADRGIPTIAYSNLVFHEGKPSFDVYWEGRLLGHADMAVPGLHNVENALAALAAALLNDAEVRPACDVLADFHGAEGRFTIKGRYKGATVITDYAHHPTAARATLAAAETWPHNNIWVIFQPLTFNRTKLLFDEFVEAFLPCDHTLMVEIYSDRETDTLGMSSRQLVSAINGKGGSAEFCSSYEDVRARLDDVIQPGDLILFLGPEEVRLYGDRLVSEGA